MNERPNLMQYRVLFKGFLVALFLVTAGNAGGQSAQIARLQSGIDLYSQGRWYEAVSELRRVQAEASSNSIRGEALFWISISRLYAGQYEEALIDMDALEDIDPENPRLAEMPYHRGRALYYLERYDEAIVNLKGYADAIRSEGGKPLSQAEVSRKSAALYWTGECLFSMSQFDRAGEIFYLITKDYPASQKYEASVYRLALIEQKKNESELLGLLKISHEELLRNMEEFRRKEVSYDQAMSAYQRRLAEMQSRLDDRQDNRAPALPEEPGNYREQYESAIERIVVLEKLLNDATEKARNAEAMDRLNSMKASAEELLRILEGNSK